MIKSENVKRKKVSKKNKTSWRKHINIDDVNQFLEDQRTNERVGDISVKADNELFVVDSELTTQKLTARQQRKLSGNRPLRSILGLENTSKVSDPIVKRNRVRTKEERQHFIGKSIAAVKAAKGIVSKRKLQSLADSDNAFKKLKLRREDKKSKIIATKDIWGVGDVIDENPKFKNQWIDKNVAVHNLSNTGKTTVLPPQSAYHKRSKAKVIELPHPGTSYNPSLKDHQELVQKAIDFEEKIVKNEDHLNRVTTDMFRKVTAQQRDADRDKEMSALVDDVVNDNHEDDESDNEYKAINPPVVVKPKDKKTRRKAREQKEIKQNLLKAKLEKKKVTDIHRLRYLKEDIRKMENKLKKLQSRKKQRKEERKFEPRRIAKLKFKEEEIDFSTPQEIAGNLRNVKVEGSVLKNRFKSFQQRNILAPTVDVGLRRRAEVKRFVRNSHKEEVVQVPKKRKNVKKS